MLWFYNLSALLLTVVVGVLYVRGIEDSLFWLYHWYDIPLHVLGGMVLGLWGSAVSLKLCLRPRRALLFVLCLAAGVGLGWELFEYAVGLSDPAKPAFLPDTLLDLACDAAGALAALSLYPSVYKRA